MLRAEDLQPADLFRVLWRHRLAAVAFALVIGALSYAYSLFIPDRYTASTLVLVEEFDLPATYVASTSTVNLRARLKTLSEQTLSRTRIDKLIDEFDLYSSPGDETPWETRLASVRGRIAVEVIGTEAFRLAYTHQDPKMAAKVANALAGFFMADSTQAVERQVRNTSGEIQDQLDSIGAQLAAKEAEIREYKAGHLGMLPEQLATSMSALGRLRQQLGDNAVDLATARGQLQQQEALVGLAPGQTASLSALGRARQIVASSPAADLDARLANETPLVRLEALRLRRDALLQQYTARHPDVAALDAEIGRAERDAAGSVYPEHASPPADGVAGPQPAVAAARQQVGRLESSRAILRSQIADYEQRIVGSPEVEEVLRELERDHNSLSTKYQDLSGRTMEAELAGNLQRHGSPFASFRILDPAVVPQVPGSPNRILFLLGGLLAGLALTCTAVVLRETLREPLNSAEEVERYASVDVLASIPIVETDRMALRRRIRQIASVSTVGSVLALVLILRLLMRA